MKGPTNSSARPNIRLLNVSATFESNPDTETNTAFPYRATIDADGVTNLMLPTVMFSQVQAISGNFATYCQTDTDKIYVYSKTNVGTITIPAISCDLSVNYINVDNVPTEDSQAVITSGGVYDALSTKADTTALNGYVTLGTDQSITGRKTIYSTTTAELPIQTEITSAGDIGGIGYYDGSGEKVIKTWGTTTGKYSIELLEGSQKSAQLVNQRAYNSSNTNDIVTIGTLKEGTAWTIQSNSNIGKLGGCNEIMLRGTFAGPESRTLEVSTIHPGNAANGVNISVSYLNTHYATMYIHPQAIYVVASSQNWISLEVYFR